MPTTPGKTDRVIGGRDAKVRNWPLAVHSPSFRRPFAVLSPSFRRHSPRFRCQSLDQAAVLAPTHRRGGRGPTLLAQARIHFVVIVAVLLVLFDRLLRLRLRLRRRLCRRHAVAAATAAAAVVVVVLFRSFVLLSSSLCSSCLFLFPAPWCPRITPAPLLISRRARNGGRRTWHGGHCCWLPTE